MMKMTNLETPEVENEPNESKETEEPITTFVHPQIKKLLLAARVKVIEKDWDRVYIIDGSEGSGKSLLALQLANLIDPTFSLDRVVFNGEAFSKAIDTSTKGQVIVFDEAFNGLASGAATSKMNRFLVRKLMECRQRNLFVFIVLPTIFLLQKYAAIFRSKGLFHVYVDKRGNRGKYKYYNERNKKTLYLNGLKMYSYRIPWLKRGYHFRGKYPVDESEYRKKKSQALVDEEAKQEKVNLYAIRFAILSKMLKETYKVPYTHQQQLLKEHNSSMDAAIFTRLVSQIPQKLTIEA